MIVGILRLELLLYAPQNLKEKRGIVRQVLDRCRNRFPVSCAETGLQDLWQRSEMGFTIVHQSEKEIHSVFEKLQAEIVRRDS